MPDVTLAELQRIILRLEGVTKDGFTDIKVCLRSLDSRMASLETRVTVLETLYAEQIKPIISQVANNRVELAKLAVKFGGGGLGIGSGIALVFAIGKAQGWW